MHRSYPRSLGDVWNPTSEVKKSPNDENCGCQSEELLPKNSYSRNYKDHRNSQTSQFHCKIICNQQWTTSMSAMIKYMMPNINLDNQVNLDQAWYQTWSSMVISCHVRGTFDRSIFIIFSPTYIHSNSMAYVTGTHWAESMAISFCTSSKCLSKFSTLPILNEMWLWR